MIQGVSRPLPEIVEDTRAFWEGCQHHELLIQRCTNCGTYRHPPRPGCHVCNSLDAQWVKASGQGIVYSFTICRQAFHPWFEDKTPYNVILVELTDMPNIRIISTLMECDNSKITIGMPVELAWVDFDSLSLYVFRPSSENKGG